MDRFLRFAAGFAIAVVYGVVATFVASAVARAYPNLATLCSVAVLFGWIAIIVVAFRKEQRWIGYGVLAAPFIVLLVVTVSCFASLSTQSATASPSGVDPIG